MGEYFDSWQLLAGLGLFLFAMRYLEAALKQLAGQRFRRFLRQSTNKPIYSILSGIVTTTIVQSSSLVSLIVLAFVGAGIIPLVNAIGIVLGANLGTTFTGWIVATLGFKLDFTTLIYPLLGIGSLSYGLLKERWQPLSQLILSLALLLMGLDLMKDSVSSLTEHMDISILKDYPLIVYLLVGVIFTAIIQSSSATMMLTLSALYADIIPLPAAAALVIGADLGTTSTVLLGSLQGAVSKRRLAMAHVIFNVSVDALAFIALLPLLSVIEVLNITDPLYGLVAFHSLFNLFGIMLFLPFIHQYARFLERWITEKKQHTDRYIHHVSEDVTDAALEALVRETQHLLTMVIQLNGRFLHIPIPTLTAQDNLASISATLAAKSKQQHYLVIKQLEGEMIHYALSVNSQHADKQAHPMENQQITQRIDRLMKAIRYGVYSAKSLKDIADDLASFHTKDNALISYYFIQLSRWTEEIYPSILTLLAKPPATTDAPDTIKTLTALQQQVDDFHHKLAYNIYSKMHDAPLNPLALSTLLNVNKEMQASEEALIKALIQLNNTE